MSTRTTLRPYQTIKNGDMSDDIISDVTILQSLTKCSYSYSWTGSSPVGSISVEVSDDYSVNPDGSVENVGTWNLLPVNLSGTVVTTIPVSGNSGSGGVDIDSISFYAIRTVYSSDSGTGSLNATIVGKVA